jgi:transaldolase/glucose-6-phosphate isomerase
MIQEDGLRGATTNPTIFEKALGRQGGSSYKTLIVKAVQGIADIFRPVYEETNGEDGFVSIEVSPLLAYDTAKTVEEARELFRAVARKNVMVKIPATAEGIPAIRQVIAEGIPVNVTLIFSVRRYREVMEAYLSGLEDRTARGLSLRGIAAVASFFVSRVDTAVDKWLDEKGISGLQGRAAIANSKVAYEAFEGVFASDRFSRLEKQGAQIQRPLWASTGTKNPLYGDVLYVEALMGPHTVNTLPPATFQAFRDHGVPAARLKENLHQAHEVLDALESHGLSLEAVTDELEKAGVQLFSDSYHKIIQVLSGKTQS